MRRYLFRVLILGLCLSCFCSGCALKKQYDAVAVTWVDGLPDKDHPAVGNDFVYKGITYIYKGRNGGVWQVDYSKMDLVGKLLTDGIGKALKPERFLGIYLNCSYNDLYGYYAEKETPIVFSNCYYNIWIDESFLLQNPDKQIYEKCEICLIDTNDKSVFYELNVFDELFYYKDLISEDCESISISSTSIEQYHLGSLRVYARELSCLYVELDFFKIGETYYISEWDSFLKNTRNLTLLQLNDILQKEVRNINTGLTLN